MKIRYTYIIALLFVLGVFSSCDRDDPDIELTAVLVSTLPEVDTSISSPASVAITAESV